MPQLPEVIRCVPLCMLDAVEGRLCLLEVLEVLEELEELEVVGSVSVFRNFPCGSFLVTFRHQARTMLSAAYLRRQAIASIRPEISALPLSSVWLPAPAYSRSSRWFAAINALHFAHRLTVLPTGESP